MQVFEEEEGNFRFFRECLAELITARLAPVKTRRRVKGRKNEIKPVTNEADTESSAAAEDLADFIEYLATEIFATLPRSLRSISYAALQDLPELKTTYSLPLDTTQLEQLTASLPPSVTESFATYALLPSTSSLALTLAPVLTSYISLATVAPPAHDPSFSLPGSQRSECEMCDREHVPLTYHHLIPKQVHAKAVRRGWARDWELQKVAWLCRACHSFVHRTIGNEELAREYSSVEALMARDDMQSWAAWVGRIRWKKR